MKMKVISISLSILMFLMMLSVGVSAENTAKIVASEITVEDGAEKVDVTISLENNPGIINLVCSVSYDSDALILTKVTDAGVLGNTSHNPALKSPYKLYWNNGTATSDLTANGVVATLTFAVSEEAQEGIYPITVSFNEDDALNYDLDSVFFETVNGSVTINSKDSPESEAAKEMKDSVAKEVVEEKLTTASYINIVGVNVADENDRGLLSITQKIETTRGKQENISAKEVEGYEFLYWGKGLGTEHSIVSTDPTYTVKATSGGTWLYAYYKKTDSTDVSVLFLDSNGDEITKSMVESGNALAAPSAPTAPGAPEFLGWKMPGDEKTYLAEEVAELKATGDKMVFVAQFAPAEEKAYIIVTVNGAAQPAKYYGQPVSVTADATLDTKTFAYWKKGDEVVSFDKTYTFKAWESCTLTAVYLDTVSDVGALRKIIIKGNVAEFIGLDTGVEEKGIIFRDTDSTPVTLGNATHKIVMAGDGNHLSFNNDLEGWGRRNYTGYAILSNGNVIYDK